jgi:hypothetical protein
LFRGIETTNQVFIELDDGNIYRKDLYLMVKTMVPVDFPLNQSIDATFHRTVKLQGFIWMIRENRGTSASHGTFYMPIRAGASCSPGTIMIHDLNH